MYFSSVSITAIYVSRIQLGAQPPFKILLEQNSSEVCKGHIQEYTVLDSSKQSPFRKKTTLSSQSF